MSDEPETLPSVPAPIPLTRTAAEILARAEAIRQVMAQAMKKDRDYGVIPGCGGKPSLLKPGAEKLAATFRFAIDPVVDDLSTADEVRYRVTARVTHTETGAHLGSGIGEASSDEAKYRWRKVVSQLEWEATPLDRRRNKYYAQGLPAQQVRTDPKDVANTILKMAKKRAFVDAVLTITGASDVFTQDLEDLEAEMAQALAGEDSQDGGKDRPPIKPPKRKSEAKPPPADAKTVEGLVEEVEIKPYTKKDKTQGIRYGIRIGAETYGSFSESDAKVAQEAKENGHMVRLSYVVNGKYLNVASIEVLGDAAEPSLALEDGDDKYGNPGESKPSDGKL